MLVFALTAITRLYGCAAGQFTGFFSEYDSADCASLNNVLEIAQERLQKLESIDTTDRDVRNFLLGVGVFFLLDFGVINSALFLTSSYALGFTETTALENIYNNMMMVSKK
jgi:hypothetical protein